ncbi:flavin reductase family protein [Oceanobacillus halotolerans]|uniref:flavin reductase family protein n=1 Tax=Oceanobacillus halotolerans TaxID=2663380 RepID=UPI0013DB970B|nr:flavin reductase family protein [Oceanobacillus halotolerans]
MNNRLFRDAMGKFATGITIVTTEYNKEIKGMTVNAFMSVSLEPKLIAISIDEKASMYPILQENKKFGLSILKEDQKELSMIFAKQIEKDREVPYKFLDEIPVIDGSLITLSCHVTETVKAGDHLIFIAEVSEMNTSDEDTNPILFYRGKYKSIDQN